MRCEKCRGSGVAVLLVADDARQLRLSDRSTSRVIPCPACNGSGIAHCCEGECAQPEK